MVSRDRAHSDPHSTSPRLAPPCLLRATERQGEPRRHEQEFRMIWHCSELFCCCLEGMGKAVGQARQRVSHVPASQPASQPLSFFSPLFPGSTGRGRAGEQWSAVAVQCSRVACSIIAFPLLWSPSSYISCASQRQTLYHSHAIHPSWQAEYALRVQYSTVL